MSKRLIYVAMWGGELEALISFLKANNYTQTEIERLESLLRKEEV